MTTTFDIEDTLWKKFDSSSLKTEITGKIRKRERPAGSDKEDIVINSLPMANDQLQRGVANVNIFVPDLTVVENGIQEKVPNHARLKTLVGMAISIVDDTYESTGDYYYEVQQQADGEDPDSKSHFVNLRINFYAINIK